VNIITTWLLVDVLEGEEEDGVDMVSNVMVADLDFNMRI
jgi:hypothetical protein